MEILTISVNLEWFVGDYVHILMVINPLFGATRTSYTIKTLLLIQSKT